MPSHHTTPHLTTPHHTINSGTINNNNSGDTKGQGVGPATSTPLIHEWGEHEIDYMMFLRMKDSPMLNLNPEEVSSYILCIHSMYTMSYY